MLLGLTSAMYFSTLVASSPRHRATAKMFGGARPLLSEEEHRALAGIWRLSLELDVAHSQGVALSLYLAEPQRAPSSTCVDEWQWGKVYLTDEDHTLIFHGQLTRHLMRWTVRRVAHAGVAGDELLCISLRLGSYTCEGRGQRIRLRCSAFAGTVLAGDDAPTIGRFSMQLLLPIKTDSAALEDRYQQRIVEHSPFAGDVSDHAGARGRHVACSPLRPLLTPATLLSEHCHAQVSALVDLLEDEEMSEQDDKCDTTSKLAGAAEACHVMSREEQAKRAWLARLNTPWGPAAHTIR